VVTPTRFRYGPSARAAAVILAIGTLALAGQRRALLPVLVIPLLVLVWVWRAGVDVSDEGLRVRAMLGTRLVRWSQVSAMSKVGTHVVVHVTGGGSFRLPGVPPADVPRLFAAGKQSYDATGGVRPPTAAPPLGRPTRRTSEESDDQ